VSCIEAICHRKLSLILIIIASYLDPSLTDIARDTNFRLSLQTKLRIPEGCQLGDCPSVKSTFHLESNIPLLVPAERGDFDG
jgi:hypothetical protein